jgi:hypothetical protein
MIDKTRRYSIFNQTQYRYTGFWTFVQTTRYISDKQLPKDIRPFHETIDEG